jgi:hypothetical protein
MATEREVRELGHPALDPVPAAVVRALRSAKLLLQGSVDHLDTVAEDYLIRRAFPGPEVREVRRKIVTAMSMIDEIGGEL